jgi:hypothetical protein
MPSFKLVWGSSQARDGLPKGKRKLGIQKFLKLANIYAIQQVAISP